MTKFSSIHVNSEKLDWFKFLMVLSLTLEQKNGGLEGHFQAQYNDYSRRRLKY